MTQEIPSAALAVILWGQDTVLDEAALARLRDRSGGLAVIAICLDGAEPPAQLNCDRMVRLPLGRQHLAYAEAIGMQLCLNEGARLAGTACRLSAPELDHAAQHFAELASGRSDVIVVPEGDARPSHLFVSARAAFIASCWAALSADLMPSRQRLAATLLGLAGRKGSVVDGKGGYAPLPPGDPAQHADDADAIRRSLGLFIGGRKPGAAPRVKRVAVVTPYYKEPDHELRRMLESVSGQSKPCHHILVSDGFPHELARRAGVTHIELGRAHGDNGNTPRYVGALVALALGHDAVAFLDADNWFEPKHIERLVARQHETGAGAVFSMRNIYLPDGTKLPGKEDEDFARRHVDTSCMLITRDCEFALHLWGQMPPEWGPLCDRVVFVELSGHRLAWTQNRTMNFQSAYAWAYAAAGKEVPDSAHQVPLALLDDFETMPPAFRTRSVDRTGRVIRVLGV